MLYGVILLAILLAFPKLLTGLSLKLLPDVHEKLRLIICLVIELVVMTPFLYGLAITNGSISKHATKLLKEKESNRWPILSLLVFRILIAIAFIIAAITSYFQLGAWGVLMVIGSGLVVLLTAKLAFRRFSGLEKRFIENFNEKEEMEKKMAPVTSSVKEKMGRYNIHTAIVEVSPDFEYIGKSLREMPFRKTSGINIIKIQRGSRNIHIPSGDEPVYPRDRLVAVGTDAQIESFKAIMEENTAHAPADADADFTVKMYQLGPESFLTGKTLKESDMRRSGCMIISVLHDNKLITNPGADYLFQSGDTVWIAGEEASCNWFLC